MQALELCRDEDGQVVNTWPIDVDLRLVSPESRTPDRYWVQVIRGDIVAVFAENEIQIETLEF